MPANLLSPARTNGSAGLATASPTKNGTAPKAKTNGLDKRVSTLTISYAPKPGAQTPMLRISGQWMDKMGWQIGERVFVVANPNVIVIGKWEHNGLPLGCCPSPELRWKQYGDGAGVLVHCKTCGFNMGDDGLLGDWHRSDDRQWCENCGASNDEAAKYCRKCLHAELPWCDQCKKYTTAMDSECNRCGRKVLPVNPERMERDFCGNCSNYTPRYPCGCCRGCDWLTKEEDRARWVWHGNHDKALKGPSSDTLPIPVESLQNSP